MDGSCLDDDCVESKSSRPKARKIEKMFGVSFFLSFQAFNEEKLRINICWKRLTRVNVRLAPQRKYALFIPFLALGEVLAHFSFPIIIVYLLEPGIKKENNTNHLIIK